MAELTTLGQLLDAAHSQFTVFDLGRRVQHIDNMAFYQIEALQAPYPYPIQGYAQFALVFWDHQQQYFIWFLKLPLDEQGLLNPAARSQFIGMVIDALGQNLTQSLSDSQQQAMANHPLSFKPSQEKLAVFNAMVRRQLGQAASSQYEYAVQYLSGRVAQDKWQQVGLQGLADICARLDCAEHHQLILRGLSHAAPQVITALCQCLEHSTLDNVLADAVLERFYSAENHHLRLYLLRALASCPQQSACALDWLEQHQLLDQDALITIAARNWYVLKLEPSRTLYLEALSGQDQRFFNQVFADIVSIPALRPLLLAAIRSPQRSTQLSTAIGGLFRATRT
ncbi:hypothetical protein NFHSH190041_27820 [Shewanella sp. NFH-SH190041]|uniref:DUF3549 family protein n=1 Tax=Shewanella sp. NFH-SH190041 TaxID=2950245 RepID=UPI0021C2602B|nr:DUF3549 family protein [Shewanella sp. NFH-SH190041]BDM65330.1 hypothetical protein NFHSH190041_27820 [Shewanella sp. NFH-SH190041]